ncbi:hypothetical protein [Xanthobacter sp. 126]|uniref:hypothetical protein n=1 Tax=Xanthobacter sp. 126 TaxID=1131814 RepID=UPI00045EAA02|nr:hypothetical protein [Xanthobacter sp. 126]
MIRHHPPLTRAQLADRIRTHDAGWHARAADRTSGFIVAGRFAEDSSIWSDVKVVYMALQYNKCIYCERVLGAELTGKSEHDVEHFRPKGRVMTWPYAARKPKVSYTFSTGTPNSIGYYWLAYDIENYACSCKGCNSDRKRDYFPILGARGAATDNIAALNQSEIPLLLFPCGVDGDDPAAFITFTGVIAQVRSDVDATAKLRAQVTIDFFSLNDREELLADRARVIRELAKAMELMNHSDPAWQARGQRDLDQITSDASPQAACARLRRARPYRRQ